VSNKPKQQQPIDYDKLATQTVQIVQERTGWTRQQTMTAILAGTLISLLLCIAITAGVAAVAEAHPVPTATLIPLPTSNAQSMMTYFKRVGLTIGAVQNLTVPNTSWHAQQAIQFTVQQGDMKGTFLILSYETTQKAELDAFAASNNVKWKTWHLSQFVNVLLLGALDNNPVVENVVEQQFTQSLVSPYRDAPTPTLQL
jgi:hypothetical protein